MSAEVANWVPSEPNPNRSRPIALALGGIFVLLFLAILGQVGLVQARQQIQVTLQALDAIQQARTSLLNLGRDLTQYRLEPSAAELRTLNVSLQMLRSHLGLLRPVVSTDRQLFQRLDQLQRALPPTLPPKWPTIALTDSRLQSIIDEQGWFNDQVYDLFLSGLYSEQQQRLSRQRQGIDFLQAAMVLLLAGGFIIVTLQALAIGREGQRQQRLRATMAQQMTLLNREQQLNSYLLTCRSLGEASEILQSFFAELLSDSSGVIYSISNSRDRMTATACFGTCDPPPEASTNECWALRRGEPRYADQDPMHIPCPLCEELYPQGVPRSMTCIPMAAHENTIGVLHFSDVPPLVRQELEAVARQLAMPLAVLRLQEELHFLSFHDPLTGLYNRRLLDEMLGRSLRTAQRRNDPAQATLGQVAVMFLDVDHFKRFNTEYGHDNGDIVLQCLAKILIENSRTEEDFICRYGGEEFVLVMPGVLLETAIARAEKIRQTVQESPGVFESRITISIGVSLYPTHGSTPDEVLKSANQALFRAKFNGRNRVVVAPEPENETLPEMSASPEG
jgi:diguanylate cyclase (GGDEF)-like protein